MDVFGLVVGVNGPILQTFLENLIGLGAIAPPLILPLLGRRGYFHGEKQQEVGV